MHGSTSTALDKPLVFSYRVLIASIMEEFNKGAWEELIERCEESGVDAFEVNFSCPHGMPERKMGMAMGQDPEILQVHESPAWVPTFRTITHFAACRWESILT